jgi:hypothetical protein
MSLILCNEKIQLIWSVYLIWTSKWLCQPWTLSSWSELWYAKDDWICWYVLTSEFSFRASGWPQSGSSHNSDSENWQSSPCWMHTSSKYLPARLAVNKRQLSRWLTQSVLISSMAFMFLHCLTCRLWTWSWNYAVARRGHGCALLRKPPAAAAVSAQADS